LDKLVSVVMPCFNAERYLGEAIRSIIAQTHGNWELLVMDDRSADGSASIVEEFQKGDKRIILHRSTENRGPAFQMNKGIGLAKGDYVCRMDSDDISLPERLEKQLSLLETQPDVVFCATNYKSFTDNGTTRSWQLIENPVDYETIKVRLLRDLPLCGPSFFAKKKILLQYPFDETLLIGEDYDQVCRIAAGNKILNLPEILYHYRKHGKSITDNPVHWKEARVDLIRKRYQESLGIYLSEDQSAFFLDLITTGTAYRVNRPFFARLKHLRRALAANPSLERVALRHFLRDRLHDYLIRTKEYGFLAFLRAGLDCPAVFTRYPVKDSLRIIVRSFHV
jgi:glycosyltransferase involved in cell wall biosynthesis